jgi:5-methyltetrahydropteroyltriglutamate--homocysteine methyltransferase
MPERLFPTQEIGSLSKFGWRTKPIRNRPVSKNDLLEAEEWGRKLSVDKVKELIELLKIKDKSKEVKEKIKEWSLIFALRFFESVGLNIIYCGEQLRSEMYQYPINHIGGFRFLGNVRSFDNKYYKMAACVEPVKFRAPYHLNEFLLTRDHTNKKLKVPITGACTLAYWSDNQWYQKKWNKKSVAPKKRNYKARKEFVMDLSKQVIRPNIQALVNAGAEYIQIDEPAASMFNDKDSLETFVEAFNEATAGIQCKFSMHICFTKYQLLVPEIFGMKKCSQFAWEFANRDTKKLGVDSNVRTGYNCLKLFKEHNFKGEIGLGVVNVHTDSLASPELIRDRILYAAKILGDPSHLYVNPDCGLRTRSWDVAFQKLCNMVKGAELARKLWN